MFKTLWIVSIALNCPNFICKQICLKETLDLIDIFRENNPTIKRYIWRKRNPIKQGKSDLFFFLISQSLLSLAPQIVFENSSPVVLIFKTDEFKRGKGF